MHQPNHLIHLLTSRPRFGRWPMIPQCVLQFLRSCCPLGCLRILLCRYLVPDRVLLIRPIGLMLERHLWTFHQTPLQTTLSTCHTHHCVQPSFVAYTFGADKTRQENVRQEKKKENDGSCKPLRCVLNQDRCGTWSRNCSNFWAPCKRHPIPTFRRVQPWLNTL